MNYTSLKQQQHLLLLDCVSGSTAYNLNIAGSDLDKKGIFIMPQRQLYGFYHQDQIANESNDEVYFEIKRFLELLTKNNPNILELLSTPKQFVLQRHPLMDLIKPEDFLSKLCLDTFAGYANTQIKKAHGLNKKINQPVQLSRKSVLDFCYVIAGERSLALIEWLRINAYNQDDCGLVKIDHFRDSYFLYHASGAQLKGIVSGPEANDVSLSSVAKGIEPLVVMNFNKDGYSVYCKSYREYRNWEAQRNEQRYRGTLQHGKNYDAKHMMHTFRLLEMAEEIACYGEVIVHRNDRDFLLKIRAGEFDLNELLTRAETKLEGLKVLYGKSDLQERPDEFKAQQILTEIREAFYRSTKIGCSSPEAFR